MNNYFTRTIEPIISAIVDEMNRKFLTKTARTQGQKILFFRDPFKLIPVDQIAEMADKFTRNEILTSNEVRQIIGRKVFRDKIYKDGNSVYKHFSDLGYDAIVDAEDINEELFDYPVIILNPKESMTFVKNNKF